MSALIETSGLYRYYGDHCAVNNVDITLNSGDILGLLGPNGAGKTSTMNLLTGNLAPSAGSILIKGIDLLDDPKQAKQNIGYLPEQPPVYKDLTVDEYLKYCAQLKGIGKKQLMAAVDKAKHRTGLVETGKRLIGNLSKGFQQRVGIAQAIINEPDVIILDEPTIGLDPIQIREIRRLIQELGKNHGVILSTHILPEVQTVCNRIHIMHEGRIAYDDATASEDAGLLTILLENPINTEELSAIDGVHMVEELGNNRYRVGHAPGVNVAPVIAALAVEKNLGLLELTPETLGLEHIFVSLTQSEHDHSGEAA